MSGEPETIEGTEVLEGVVEEHTEEETQAIMAAAAQLREHDAVQPVGTYAIQPMQEAGTLALAALSDDDFERRITMLKAGRVRIARIQRELLRPGVDYGLIPGTGDKPTLLKPGAEKLCDFYRFAADFKPEVEYGDGEKAPAIRVLTRCELHLGDLSGPIVSTGYGSANSWETRYRWRKGGKPCPECGNIGSLTGKPTGQGSHWCIPDRGGCGANISVDRYAKIEGAEKVENPDPLDLANTLVKMAEKRAHIDATLRATATSGLFTQDVEDQVEGATPRANGNGGGSRSSGEAASRSAGERQGEDVDDLPPIEVTDEERALIERDQREGQCPVHHKTWKERKGSRGTFWSCGTKVGDGWCEERPSEWWKARHETGA